MLEGVGVPEVDQGWSFDAPDVVPLGFDPSFLEESVDCLHCGSDVHMVRIENKFREEFRQEKMRSGEPHFPSPTPFVLFWNR